MGFSDGGSRPCSSPLTDSPEGSHLWPPPQKLIGHLDDLLAGYAVRLRRSPLDGSFCSKAAEFYVAPLHEVGEAVLAEATANPYLSPAQPGFRAPGAHVRVLFEAAEPSGNSAGEPRARAVQLVVDGGRGVVMPPPEVQAEAGVLSPSCEWNCELRARPLRAAMCAAGLRAVGLVAQVVNEWRSLCTSEALCEKVSALDDEMRRALGKADGDELCRVLLQAAGGLSPPGASFSLSPEHFLEVERRNYELAQEELRIVQEQRLLSIVVVCLTNLDLQYNAIRARVLPALRYLQDLLAHSIDDASASRVGRLQWCKIRGLVVRGLQSLPERVVRLQKSQSRVHRLGGALWHWGERSASCSLPATSATTSQCSRKRETCSVVGCGNLSCRRTLLKDVFGTPGPRCVKHGARQCNVVDCNRMSCARLVILDHHGPPGRRCYQHGHAVAKLCNVLGCAKQPRRITEAEDEFGPPGPRCRTHGAERCTATACQNRSWGRVGIEDTHGPPEIGRAHV